MPTPPCTHCMHHTGETRDTEQPKCEARMVRCCHCGLTDWRLAMLPKPTHGKYLNKAAG